MTAKPQLNKSPAAIKRARNFTVYYIMADHVHQLEYAM